MRIRRRRALAAGATLALGTAALAATTYAPGPEPPWEFGWSATETLAPGAFRRDAVETADGGLRVWHPSAGPDGYYPYVAWNPTRRTLVDPTRSWAVRRGELALEGSNDGRYAIVRFVVPVAGRYRVKARFTGIHVRVSTTDVHVRVGDAPVFDGVVEGYGGDPRFRAIAGAAPQATWTGDAALRAGDVVAFAVGYGRNRTHFNDTTGLIVRVRRVRAW